MPSDFHFCSLLCYTIHLFIIRNVPECSRAFRVIYPEEIYENVLNTNKLITIEERRKDHCVVQVCDMAQEKHKLKVFCKLPHTKAENNLRRPFHYLNM